MANITLTTDFGLEDEYVGVLKGVILSIHARATIIDITHQLPAHDVTRAALLVEAVYPYFRPGTVHVVVVDPGVGSARKILAVQVAEQYMIAPDNGVLSRIFDTDAVDRVVSITNAQFFLPSVSATFHGRDIMAPVAAHIAKGLDIGSLGSEMDLDEVVRLPLPAIRKDAHGKLVGHIAAIDHFGNLISNIREDDLSHFCRVADKFEIQVHVGAHIIKGLADSYAMLEKGRPLAIIGSRGYLEIAINCGRAAEFYDVAAGAEVSVSLQPRFGNTL
jgi:S-adenosylmethionine hydrolase